MCSSVHSPSIIRGVSSSEYHRSPFHSIPSESSESSLFVRWIHRRFLLDWWDPASPPLQWPSCEWDQNKRTTPTPPIQKPWPRRNHECGPRTPTAAAPTSALHRSFSHRPDRSSLPHAITSNHRPHHATIPARSNSHQQHGQWTDIQVRIAAPPPRIFSWNHGVKAPGLTVKHVIVWMSSNNPSGRACVDLGTRYVNVFVPTDLVGGRKKKKKYPWLRQHGNRQDRRPITPPPCIRLIVQDAVTRKEVDIKLVSSLPFCFRLMEGGYVHVERNRERSKKERIKKKEKKKKEKKRRKKREKKKGRRKREEDKKREGQKRKKKKKLRYTRKSIDWWNPSA